jgi:hypothetical protein
VRCHRFWGGVNGVQRILGALLDAPPHRVTREGVWVAPKVLQVSNRAALPRQQAPEIRRALAPNVCNQLEGLWSATCEKVSARTASMGWWGAKCVMRCAKQRQARANTERTSDRPNLLLHDGRAVAKAGDDGVHPRS